MENNWKTIKGQKFRLTPALPEKEIQKQVHWTQYQFRVFKKVDCFMSLRRRYLDKAVTF